MSDETPAVDTAAVQRAVRISQLLAGSRRMQTGLSVEDARNLGRVLLALNMVANLTADMFAERDRMLRAGRAGDAAGETRADAALAETESSLAGALLALGFVTITDMEAPDGQEG